MDSGGAALTLSKQELRKQKLMEYLVEKGKLSLRAPNPKPYLQEKPAKPKKLTETFVKAPCAARGKENQKTDPPTQRWRENKTQVPGVTARAPLQTRGPTCITHNATVHSTTMVRTTRSCTSASMAKICRDKAGPSGSHPRAGGPSGSRSCIAPVELRRPGAVGPAGSRPGTVLLDRRIHNAGTVRSKTFVAADLPVRTATCVRPNLRKTASIGTVPSKALAAAAAPSMANLQPSSTMRSKSDLASVSSKLLPGTCQMKVNPPVRQRSPTNTTSSVKLVASRHCRAHCKGASDPSGSKDASSEPLLIRPQRKNAANPAPPRNRDTVPRPRTGHRATGPQRAKDQAPSRARGSALHKVMLQAISKMDKETSRQAASRVNGPETDSKVLKTTRMRNKTTEAAQPSTLRTRQLKGPAVLKTPAVQSQTDQGGFTTAPRNDQQKSITAQEERLKKLQEWREAKGISYKRPPMPIRPSLKKAPTVPQHYWSTMEAEDEAQHLVCTIDSALTDCMKLLQEGCPTEQVTALLSRLPVAQKFAKYWICQARIMERAGNLEVLPLFEQAVQAVLEVEYSVGMPAQECQVSGFTVTMKILVCCTSCYEHSRAYAFPLHAAGGRTASCSV
uniref:Cytoskeleton-associated protein 2 C-terminal domain-containing protein n=1 Tax=Scleropages formosus TaxID=113540 RepID=A0A8C9V6G6_SCLFO